MNKAQYKKITNWYNKKRDRKVAEKKLRKLAKKHLTPQGYVV